MVKIRAHNQGARLGLEEARELILEGLEAPAAEEIPLQELEGRVLAEEIRAREDYPPFARCLVDGYALLARATIEAGPSSPVRLEIKGRMAAGDLPSLTVESGACARVLTGAPLPPGADAVVAQEEVKVEAGAILLPAPVAQGSHIDPAGTELRMGELALGRKTLLHAGALGMLAALGQTRAMVYKQPRVAVIVTGSELVPPGALPRPGQLRASNLIALEAATREAGARVVLAGLVPDRLEILEARLQEALAAKADVVVTSGGTGEGDLDLMPQAYEKAGASLLFRGVDIRPGGSVLWARLGQVDLAGLPGNPSAALTAFELLVRPQLLARGGRRDWRRPRLQGILEEGVHPRRGSNRQYIWGVAQFAPGGCLVRPAGVGQLSSLARANALIELKANKDLQPGETVSFLFLTERLNG